MDVHTPERRSHNMSRIKSRNTRPEMMLRRALHARGLRYRLHVRGMPGSPDLAFPRLRAVILVNGCFWHGHDCPMCKKPATRPEFWHKKITANVARDRHAAQALGELGWRRLTVWECAMKGRARLRIEELSARVTAFLLGKMPTDEIAGDWVPCIRADGAVRQE